MIKSYKYLGTLAAFFVLVLLLYTWFLGSEYFVALNSWAKINPFTFWLIIVFLKVLSLVWPPLPGAVFTLGSIPIMGIRNAYLSDFTGNIIGSSISFYLGKKYGYRFLHKLLGEDAVKKIRSFKIKKKKELEAVFVMRVFTGLVGLEVISYGSGLIGVGFFSFLVASVLSHLVVGIPIFVLVGSAIQTQSYIFSGVLLVLGLILVWKLKGRYLE